MKKIFLILITGFFISTNAYSDHNNFTEEIANKIVANSDNSLKKRWKKVHKKLNLVKYLENIPKKKVPEKLKKS